MTPTRDALAHHPAMTDPAVLTAPRPVSSTALWEVSYLPELVEREESSPFWLHASELCEAGHAFRAIQIAYDVYLGDERWKVPR